MRENGKEVWTHYNPPQTARNSSRWYSAGPKQLSDITRYRSAYDCGSQRGRNAGHSLLARERYLCGSRQPRNAVEHNQANL
jgi:hypothetical protein